MQEALVKCDDVLGLELAGVEGRACVDVPRSYLTIETACEEGGGVAQLTHETVHLVYVASRNKFVEHGNHAKAALA